MLSKEEKNYARKIVLVKDTINMMIDDLFEEVTVKGEFKEGVFEVNIKDFVNEILNEKLKSLFPYKFEDLKAGMWVYDRKPFCEEFTFIKITKILSEKDCEYLYHDKTKKVFFDNMESSAREFEENRFFPVQMANREAEEHERNSVHDI